jgi:hypothetical protein
VTRDRSDTIRITIWLATREPATWVTAAEVLLLGLVLFVADAPAIRLWIGLPLLGHLGYKALTSLPMGQVPGRPAGASRKRRNLTLRSQVMAFLDEVRQAEKCAQHARTIPPPRGEVEEEMRRAARRVMAAAAEVVKATGRYGV